MRVILERCIIEIALSRVPRCPYGAFAAQARFLVVGAHALAVHGFPRATQDIDLWIDPVPSNAERVWSALIAFGAPVGQLGVTRDDLVHADMAIQLGLPPNRIDLLTGVTGIGDFDWAWRNRMDRDVRGRQVPFIGREALLQNKRAAGRKKDLADADLLEGIEQQRP